jgi:phage terminase Nu1 subunit (DNA packaging protein)
VAKRKAKPRGRPPTDPATVAPGATDGLFGIRAVAWGFGLSDRRIHQLAKDGVVVRQGVGSYWILRSIRNYLRFIRSGAEAEERPIGSFDSAKTRKMLADAELAELELLDKAGSLVRLDHVSEIWETMLGRIRSRILAIPPKAAPSVQDETDLAIIEAEIRSVCEDCLSELALLELPGEDLGALPDVDPPTAGKANGRRMGGSRKTTQ